MPSLAEFRRYFSIPREPNTIRTPGQFFDYSVPSGKKAVITDIYVENLGVADASLEILEQRLPASFELRYVYRTKPNQVLSVNLSTGLRLGDEAAIRDNIRVKTGDSSSGNLLIRVNGQLWMTGAEPA
jgi:hypothetical protein